jgi:trans-aconitate methyltransferase
MTFNPNQLLNNSVNLINLRGAGNQIPVPPTAPKPAAPPPEASKEILPPPEFERGLYRDAYSRLGLLSIANVADLGCGYGNFTSVMVERNQKPEVYIGVDISHNRIKTARASYPGWNFVYGDFMAREVREKYERYEAYLLLNVVDILEDDLGILDSLPSGKPLIFSMPRTEKEGSLRFFTDQSSLRDHYSAILNIKSIGRFKSSEAVYSMILAHRW